MSASNHFQSLLLSCIKHFTTKREQTLSHSPEKLWITKAIYQLNKYNKGWLNTNLAEIPTLLTIDRVGQGFLGIQYIGVFNFRYTVFLCLKLGIKYSLSINFGYLQSNYYKNQECNHCFFSLLLLSFSLFFLFLLSSFFVAVILELLMLKKRAFWCLFTQITANFVTLVFKKLVRCISPLLPQFQVWPSKLKLFCLQSIDSERNLKNTQSTMDKVGCGKLEAREKSCFKWKAIFFASKENECKGR